MGVHVSAFDLVGVYLIGFGWLGECVCELI